MVGRFGSLPTETLSIQSHDAASLKLGWRLLAERVVSADGGGHAKRPDVILTNQKLRDPAMLVSPAAMVRDKTASGMAWFRMRRPLHWRRPWPQDHWLRPV